MSCAGYHGLSMTSRGSRRLLLSGSELKNEGAERRPFLVLLPADGRRVIPYGLLHL